MKIYIILLLGTVLLSAVSLAADYEDLLFTIRPGTWYGCSDMMERLRLDNYMYDYVRTGDKEPFKKTLKAAVLSGTCVRFLPGQRVVITNADFVDHFELLKVIREDDLEKFLRKEVVTMHWLNLKALIK